MGHRLNGKRLLVIGGAKYLGKAVAQAAADDGAVVVLGARDEKLAWSVVAGLGGKHAQEHSVIHLDVTDEPSILAGRVGATDDIADAALWLLGADYVSGETIHVDGGSRNA